MSLYIADPNSVNTVNQEYNGMPTYENMYIDVSLTAQRRNRSMLVIQNDNVKLSNETGSGSVNFLGFNQNTTNYTNKFFTTNYYDESTGDNIQYESFGIESIKITTNSSFIPQVSIKFVDVRGLSFFNQEKSPYRILFDFPPPTFNLRVKGFYGKTIEYLLHLVKYTSEFKAENGNFYIDADFVAVTFAPLSDVLFRYVVNTGMLLSGGTVSLASNGKPMPKNTYELITRTKELYSKVENDIKYRTEFSEFDSLKNDVENINACIKYINDEWLNNDNTSISAPILFFGNSVTASNGGIYNIYNEIPKGNYSVVQNLIDLKVGGDSSVQNKDVYIGYKKNVSNSNTINVLTSGLDNSKYFDYLNKFIISLNNLYSSNVTLITDDMTFVSYILLTEENFNMICIKLTPLLIELNKQLVSKNNRRVVLSDKVNEIVNDAVSDTLNMKPTIYNIFSVILNDVDTFFKTLKDVSFEAENNHHNLPQYKSIILNSKASYEDDSYIYAFPSIIDEQYNGNTTQQILVSPKKISDKMDKHFPEMDFIDKFLNTFANQAVEEENLMDRVNSDGSYVWIPNTTLNSNVFSVETAYSSINPFTGKFEEKNIINALLNRFYVISQYTHYSVFWQDDVYAKTYGEAEAINLAMAINSIECIDLLKKLFENYNQDNLTSFYTNVLSKAENYTTINNSTVMPNGYDYDNDSNNNSSETIAISKDSDYYIGCVIIDGKLNEVIPTSGPIKTFYDKFKPSWVKFFDKYELGVIDYNLLYFKDYGDDIQITNFYSGINKNVYHHYPTVFSDLFYNNDDIFTRYTEKYNKILTFLNNNNVNVEVKAMYVLAMCSRFIVLPDDILINAGIYEVPFFYLSLIGAILNDIDKSKYNQVLAFFNNLGDEIECVLAANNFEKFANMCNRVKSVHDVGKFKDEYRLFLNMFNDSLLSQYINMITEYITNDKFSFSDSLKSGGKYYPYITAKIMARKNLVLTNNMMFRTESPSNFLSIQDLNIRPDTERYRKNTNKFFESFLSMIKTQLDARKGEFSEKERKVKAMINDDDIINQTYFSFKKINDKWLANPDSNSSVYPFNGENKLIDSFIFVDRAMNPIGDTVINPEPLIDLFNDPNATLLTVISQLLSSNYFEFFPLQNFMIGNDNFLEEAFKMDVSGYVSTKPCFVCMYIGGYSQYDSTQKGNGFNSDGISSLDELSSLPDFQGENNISDVNHEIYKKTKAFKVNFGTQNQSMFTDIKVDSKEFPETNEAIQILSRLAGDESKTAPIPKGQNLYNLYENRAYSATISGLGNAMIQPTQYFEINNVPLYYGVYLILNVEHTISNNFMKTSFTGTKVAKYPKKRVTDACTFVQYDGKIGQALAYNSGDITSGLNFYLASVFKKEDFKNVRVSGKFNKVRSNGSKHQGIDLAAPIDTPILATHAGSLTVKEQVNTTNGLSWGKYVEIVNNGTDKFTTRYAHLNKYADNRKLNDVYDVKVGDIIGYVGSSGGSTGPHLHIELIANGKVYNPEPSLSSSMYEIFDK